MSQIISQANTSLMEAQQEMTRMQMENERLTNSLSEENDRNEKVQLELLEQVSK